MTASRENPKRKRQIISPADFYTSEEEKTKLNWFCFEFALELEMFIHRDRKLRSQLWRKKIETYFPTIGDLLVDRLLTVTAKAWDSQTEA